MRTTPAKQVFARGTTPLCRGITRGGAGVEYPGRPEFAVRRKTAYNDAAELPPVAAPPARNHVAAFSGVVGATQMAKTSRDTPKPKRPLQRTRTPDGRHRPISAVTANRPAFGREVGGKGRRGSGGRNDRRRSAAPGA